jgi:glyoxylase-like metal-dependent hydrolase (beta-lactamase superfamily II)
MIFQQIPSGGDRNYGYLAACEKTKLAAVIDPSPDPMPCWNRIGELNLEPAYIINTHSHSDHSGGNGFFQGRSAIPLVAHPAAPEGDLRVKNGQILKLGETTMTFIHTPGHTQDSICVLIGKELVTGDTLFVGKVGGTYSTPDARQEFESLKELMKLDDGVRVWPGHNYGLSPSSTIGHEKSSNPFILRLHDFQEFVWLKENWLEYKREHNIP